MKHTGKRKPTENDIKMLSLDYHVSDNMPPVYLIACTDDRKVKVENSIRAYKKKSFMESTHWNEALAQWLKERNFM